MLLNRALLIQNIYEVDPLICPKYSSEMRVIAVIKDSDVIKKILKHIGLRDVKRKPRPTASTPPINSFPIYDEQPVTSADDYIKDPDLCASGALPNRGQFL